MKKNLLLISTIFATMNLLFAQETLQENSNSIQEVQNSKNQILKNQNANQTKNSEKKYSVLSESKSNITFGITPLESSSSENSTCEFGGMYLLGDFVLSVPKISVGTKIYYRINSSDSWENNQQKIDIKRAYLRYRPFANNFLEFSAGKLYSYYLPGNFFNLAEIYTGSSRWGKTGVATKFDYQGFFGGFAIPLSESYTDFAKSFGINFALGYNFSELNKNIPIKFSSAIFFTRQSENKIDYENDYSFSVSAQYSPSLKGFISKLSLTTTYSYNAESYVSSSIFKKVSNYKVAELKNTQLFSVNYKNNFGPVQFSLESEVGHSLKENMIPLYLGTQVSIPIEKHLELRPRFYYYAAFDSQNSSASRQTYEFYPRFWITLKNISISLAADFEYKQTSSNDWNLSWSLPCYVQLKIK